MIDYFIQLFNFIGIYNESDMRLAGGLIGVAAFSLVMRVLLCGGYKSQSALVSLSAKDIAKDGKPDTVRSALFRRAAADYRALGERGIGVIDAFSLAEKSALKLRILIWKMKGLESFVRVLETSALPFGILAVVVSENKPALAVSAVALFVLTAVISAVFDYDAARESMLRDTAFLLDKEIGRLFMTDTTGSINNFRVELKSVMSEQTACLADTITALDTNLSAAATSALEGMSEAVAKTLDSVSVSADIIKKPLNEWRDVIKESAAAQDGLNVASKLFAESSERFEGFLNRMEEVIDRYGAEVKASNAAVERQLDKLNGVYASARETSSELAVRADALNEALEYIKINQAALENSLNQYEAALRNMISEIGGGLGRIIDTHLRESYAGLSSGINDSIKQINAGNNALLTRLSGMFENLTEQTRSQTALIVSMKEQTELRVERVLEKFENV